VILAKIEFPSLLFLRMSKAVEVCQYIAYPIDMQRSVIAKIE
jgi:hypothetical protein